MTSVCIQELLDKQSVPESETSYLGKARLVHYHAGKNLEFAIPRYHYNFIKGLNILSIGDNVESVTIQLKNGLSKKIPKHMFLSGEDIKTTKMDTLLNSKNLLEAPIYIPENIELKLIFQLNKTENVVVPVLIEYGTINVEELVKISESKYIMHSYFNDKKIYFKQGLIKDHLD